MKRLSRFAGPLLVGSSLLCSSALAADVSVDGADKLASAFAKYTGSKVFEDGYVSVTPLATTYAVSVDLDRILAEFEEIKSFVQVIGELGFQTEPLEDGTWRVTHMTIPTVAVDMFSPGGPSAFELTLSDDFVTDAIYDPGIAAFLSSTQSLGELTIRSDEVDESGVRVKSVTKQQDMRIIATGQANEEGGVDLELVSDTRLTEVIADADGVVIQVEAEGGKQEVGFEGFEALGLLNLVAHVVELIETIEDEPSEQQIGGLKDAIKQALPIFVYHGQVHTLEALTVTTPFGGVTASNLVFGFGLTGLIKDGLLEFGFGAEDLVVSNVGQPQWMQDLMPTYFAAEAVLTGYDLAGPMDYFLEVIGENGPDDLSDEDSAEMLRLLLPFGTVRLEMKETVIGSDLYKVLTSGSMLVMPDADGGDPDVAVELTVVAGGLDEVLDIVRDAGNDNAQLQQLMFGLTFARGLANVDDDGVMSWDIKFDTATEAVEINGQKLSP